MQQAHLHNLPAAAVAAAATQQLGELLVLPQGLTAYTNGVIQWLCCCCQEQTVFALCLEILPMEPFSYCFNSGARLNVRLYAQITLEAATPLVPLVPVLMLVPLQHFGKSHDSTLGAAIPPVPLIPVLILVPLQHFGKIYDFTLGAAIPPVQVLMLVPLQHLNKFLYISP